VVGDELGGLLRTLEDPGDVAHVDRHPEVAAHDQVGDVLGCVQVASGADVQQPFTASRVPAPRSRFAWRTVSAR
jgi:hypothetical protein